MREYLKSLAAPLIGLLVLAPAASGARAAQEITLVTDQPQIMKMAQSPATVIVGNPAVADVTMDGKTLFFHPRAYGLTSIIVLDHKGEKLGDFLVRVIFEDRDSASVYSPEGRETFTCVRDCEPTLRIGDSNGQFGTFTAQSASRSGVAAGQAMGEETYLPVEQSGYVSGSN